jgi:hypothetical protein
MNSTATRKTGVNVTGFQSKKAASQDKFTDTVEVDLPTLLLKAMKDLTVQVEALKTRIVHLENKQRDDGK